MKAEHRTLYHTKSAVLFIIFNRPDVTERVFEQIKLSRPPRLYVAADGPRLTKPGEVEQCTQARKITEHIDWDCEVKYLFRETNLGCKEAVSSAITWFFDQEEEGIVLEDDCLPANSFFRYCDEMLERYRYDTRIRHIGGCNLQHGNIRGTASYYYSNITHVWGWAGWRRVWKHYDKNLSQYNAAEVKPQLEKVLGNEMLATDWEKIFKRVQAGEIDTWDYQLGFLNYFNNSLSTMPNCNLITNIGFGENSTHTYDANDPNANIPLQEIGEITHPVFVLPDKEADFFTFNNDFHILRRQKRYNKPKRKLKRWVVSLFNKKATNKS